MIKQERLLIISNNVLSTTNNNGKTILSCIDSIPQDQVQQLYFSNETPTVSGYRYFKISDTDVIRTRFMGVAPGTSIAECDANDTNPQKRRVSLIKRNSENSLQNLVGGENDSSTIYRKVDHLKTNRLNLQVPISFAFRESKSM